MKNLSIEDPGKLSTARGEQILYLCRVCHLTADSICCTLKYQYNDKVDLSIERKEERKR